MHSPPLEDHDAFAAALRRWRLEPDGEAIVTHAARLLPVRWRGRPAMLKVATAEEERQGGLLMQWWRGRGAAEVFAAEADAIVMERGGGPLTSYVRAGRDDEACAILCTVAARLHTPRADPPPPSLVPLQTWFADLQPAACREGGLLARAAAEARDLLAAPREETVLHGDIHHDNVLDFGPRGWLVIDPKGLYGERGFDFANLFCNPDIDDDGAFACSPERFARRLALVTQGAGLERRRLLQWIIAWTGLSAVWQIAVDGSPAIDFEIMKLAIAAFERD